MQPIRENVNIDIMCESQPNFTLICWTKSLRIKETYQHHVLYNEYPNIFGKHTNNSHWGVVYT